jgi:anaerobic selenocysteine-containing dehydrogenase
VAALADEIDMDGPARVRALITIAGNPVLSAPDAGRLDEAEQSARDALRRSIPASTCPPPAF